MTFWTVAARRWGRRRRQQREQWLLHWVLALTDWAMHHLPPPPPPRVRLLHALPAVDAAHRRDAAALRVPPAVDARRWRLDHRLQLLWRLPAVPRRTAVRPPPPLPSPGSYSRRPTAEPLPLNIRHRHRHPNVVEHLLHSGGACTCRPNVSKKRQVLPEP